MNFISYNEEISHATEQLLDAFNNVRIKRKRGNRVQVINVPLVLGTRSRILKSLGNRDKTIKLPVMSLFLDNITLLNDNLHSVNNELLFAIGNSVNLENKVATPIEATFQMDIIARHQSDLNQIISNFIALMQPDIYVTWPNPKGQDNLKSQVIWDGSIGFELADEIDEASPFRVTASTSFKLKMWIFPGEGVATDETSARIRSINYCDDYAAPLSANVAQEVLWSRWYDVGDYKTPMSTFCENVSSDNYSSAYYDQLRIVDELSGSYWLDNMYGTLSGDIYDFKVSGDLITLIDNVTSPDLHVVTIDVSGRMFEPSTILDNNWGSIWRRMLSGDLQCGTLPASSQIYQYLINEEFVFLLYENYSIIPILS